MEFGSQKASFDGWIVLRQFRGLRFPDPENRDSSQFARIAEREWAGNREVSLLGHLSAESVMLLYHFDELRGVGIPMVAALHQHERVLLHYGRLGWIVNGARVDQPRPVQFDRESACLDCRIAIRPRLCLRRGLCLKDKNAAERGVVHEGSGNQKLVFGSHLTDIGHVLFLKLRTRLFAQLWSVGRAIQQNKEVLRRFGIGLGLCWCNGGAY